MPPKGSGAAGATARPQHARKPSTTNSAAGGADKKNKATKEVKEKAREMPPPPKPVAILEPEVDALEDSLKVSKPHLTPVA